MTVKCPNCRTDNPDTAKFCSECGTRLGPAKDISITKTIKTPVPIKTIAGKYHLLEKLGEGGMGVVYKAKDMRLDRTVALKFLPEELTLDKNAKKRFIQEAKAAAALNHPNITIIHEIDEAENQTFIAMEYIDGQSLKNKLKDGPMDIDEAKDIALQVADGLKEAHEKGIVHRDIKPANIMLTPEGQAKIMDFGLANNRSNPFLVDEGQALLDAWLNTGMAEPYITASTTWGTAPVPAVPKMFTNNLTTNASGKRGAIIPADIFKAGNNVIIVAHIMDENGLNISGAQVFMEIKDSGGNPAANLQGFSDDTGTAVLNWKTSQREAADTYTATITSIIKSGYELDPNHQLAVNSVSFVIQ